MKPTRYQALWQAVEETFDFTEGQRDSIENRVEEIRNK